MSEVEEKPRRYTIRVNATGKVVARSEEEAILAFLDGWVDYNDCEVLKVEEVEDSEK